MTSSQIQNTKIGTTEKELANEAVVFAKETAYQTAILNEQTSQLLTQIRQLTGQLAQTSRASGQ